MPPSGLLSRLTGASASRAGPVLAVAAVLGIGAAVLALRLQPTAATSSFVSSSSAPYESTQTFYRQFGEEPIAVLVHGDLQRLLVRPPPQRLPRPGARAAG